MITLYEHPLSPYAQKVKIALREKGLEFEAVAPAGIGAGGAQGDFAKASPRGEVPALVDGEVSIFDSTSAPVTVTDPLTLSTLSRAPAGIRTA